MTVRFDFRSFSIIQQRYSQLHDEERSEREGEERRPSGEFAVGAVPAETTRQNNEDTNDYSLLTHLDTYSEVGIVAADVAADIGLFESVCEPLVVLPEKYFRNANPCDLLAFIYVYVKGRRALPQNT